MNIVSREVSRQIWFNCRCVITIIMLISLAQSKRIKTNINKHQLQYIADHLTHDECLLLIRSLHEEETIIPEIEDLPPLVGEDSSESCEKKLMRWSRSRSGRKRPQLMDMRLKQLGHNKIANKLSITNNHDKRLAMNADLEKILKSQKPRNNRNSKSKRNRKKNQKGKNKKEKKKSSSIGVWIVIIVLVLILLPLSVAACVIIPKVLAKSKKQDHYEYDPYSMDEHQDYLMDPMAASGLPHAGMTPGMIPGMAPGMAPGLAPGIIPGMAPGMIPGMVPGMVPGMAPGMVPGMGLGMVPGMNQGMSLGMSQGMGKGKPSRKGRTAYR